MISRPRILVTRRLPDVIMDRIGRDYDAWTNGDDHLLTGTELVAAAADCDAIFCAPGDPLTGDVISRLPGCVAAIATFSVGHDHVDVTAAHARGLPVFNTPGVLTNATAEIALLLMLGAARRAWEGQKLLRDGKWTGWRPTQLVGTGLSGKRLGIFGMGRIGGAVATRARAFGMEIHYCNRTRLPAEKEHGARYWTDAVDLFSRSDFLSLHCPATPETYRLMNAERIEWLPPGAIVINTARGAVVDDEALIAALRGKRIAAAGLDVYADEPGLNAGYRELDNAYLLPHLGSATLEARTAMGNKALDNLDAFFAGGEPQNRVD